VKKIEKKSLNLIKFIVVIILALAGAILMFLDYSIVTECFLIIDPIPTMLLPCHHRDRAIEKIAKIV